MSRDSFAKRRELPNIVQADYNNILAWFNTNVNSRGYIRGVEKTIHSNRAGSGNVGAAITDLHSFDVPANTLFTDGDFLRCSYAGFFNTTANTKLLTLSIGGFDNQEDTAGLSQLNGGSDNNWVIDLVVFRLSSTTLKLYTVTRYGFLRIQAAGAIEIFGAGFLGFGRYRNLTVSNLNSTTMNIKIRATGAANDDILQLSSIVNATQMV